VFKWNGTVWQYVGGQVNADLNAISVTLSQFSDYALFETDEVYLNCRVFVEGAYQTGSNEMHFDLNNAELIPTTSSYPDHRIVSSIPDNIADWIYLELRTTADGDAKASRSFFMRNDGWIIDDDGSTSDLAVAGVTEGNYFIVIQHRNHLPIMSSSALLLSGNGSP
jgi:hypothetical protein